MEVKTGFGYFEDNQGNIVGKYELPIGDHPLRKGYSFVEVASKAELDAVEIYEEPKSSEDIKEGKIQKEMNSILRKQAVSSLKEKGQIE